MDSFTLLEESVRGKSKSKLFSQRTLEFFIFFSWFRVALWRFFLFPFLFWALRVHRDLYRYSICLLKMSCGCWKCIFSFTWWIYVQWLGNPSVWIRNQYSNSIYTQYIEPYLSKHLSFLGLWIYLQRVLFEQFNSVGLIILKCRGYCWDDLLLKSCNSNIKWIIISYWSLF